MTDRIDFGGAPWQAIPRDTLRDPRLSHKAKGGLVILLSHDEGWVRSCIAILQREGRGGRAVAQAIMKELRELGYADLITERSLDGQLRRHYIVRAIPTHPAHQSGESPVDGIPDRQETQPSGNQSIEVEAPDVEPHDVETQVQTLAPRPRDALWDAFVEVLGLEGQPTKQERKSMNVAVSSVRDVWPGLDELADDEVLAEVQRRATNYDRRYPVASLTAPALARHWGECKNAPMKRNGDERTDRIVQDIFR